jgi:hypothetical protein
MELLEKYGKNEIIMNYDYLIMVYQNIENRRINKKNILNIIKENIV